MIIDFSSNPPLPELRGETPHLQNYRRVYRASEEKADQSTGPAALAEYLKLYEGLDARAIVVKARDAESTFGFKVDNGDLAAFCRAQGSRFIGFAGVDPHKGERAVAELEFAVKELGLRGLNLQCFEHKLQANDPLLYPLYAKCVELDIPVNIHCGVNFSRQSLMKYGRPEALDEVLVAFPDLRVCAAPPGWPWINELIAVAWRHPNLWIGLVAVRPKILAVAASGYEPLLQYGKTILKDRIIFGSSFPMMPVERSVAEIRALPIPEEIQHRWLYANAAELLRLG